MSVVTKQDSNRVLVGEVKTRLGEKVQIRGWVQTLRLQSRIQFVIVNDETGAIQVTNRRGTNPTLDQQVEDLTVGSAIALSGRAVEAQQVKLGGIEVLLESVDVVSIAEQPLPIDEKSNADLRLDWRFLDLRGPRQHLTLKVFDVFEQSMRAYLRSRRFTELHTPKLMGAASESGAEVFRVEYFGAQAFLAQSPQFYKQMAIAAGIERVLEVGPIFRAEPSFTSRHSTEFTGLDLEMAWIDSVEDVMRMEEDALVHAIEATRDALGEQIQEVFGVEITVPTQPFPRMTMEEAHEELQLAGWEPEQRGRKDLDGEGERTLSKIVKDRTGHEFVFVTDYPIDVRPFYHMRRTDRPDITMSFDLLWNGLEVTTGAQREHRYEVLAAQAEEKGVPLDSISDYANAFRYGCPPHGGLGAGMNRFLMKLLDLPSIREATMFFRGPNRLRP